MFATLWHCGIAARQFVHPDPRPIGRQFTLALDAAGAKRWWASSGTDDDVGLGATPQAGLGGQAGVRASKAMAMTAPLETPEAVLTIHGESPWPAWPHGLETRRSEKRCIRMRGSGRLAGSDAGMACEPKLNFRAKERTTGKKEAPSSPGPGNARRRCRTCAALLLMSLATVGPARRRPVMSKSIASTDFSARSSQRQPIAISHDLPRLKARHRRRKTRLREDLPRASPFRGIRPDAVHMRAGLIASDRTAWTAARGGGDPTRLRDVGIGVGRKCCNRALSCEPCSRRQGLASLFDGHVSNDL
ncbi:hypothetical protein FQR65_LT20390 [Abscondita terminalis]|nr:hypothetical protein FQR65_LT20390 [Abscondita terminalis]